MEKLRENYRNLERFYAEDMNKMTHIINSLSDNAQVFISPTNNEKIVGEIDADIKLGDVVIDDGSVNPDQKGFIYKVENIEEIELNDWIKCEFSSLTPDDDTVMCAKYTPDGTYYAMNTEVMPDLRQENGILVTVENIEGVETITDGVTDDIIVNVKPSLEQEGTYNIWKKEVDGEAPRWLSVRNGATNGVSFCDDETITDRSRDLQVKLTVTGTTAYTVTEIVINGESKAWLSFKPSEGYFKSKDKINDSDVKKTDFCFFAKKTRMITVVTLSTLNDGSGGGETLMSSVTYSQLVSLRDNNSLVPGLFYRIIDYMTTTVQEGTRSADHPFDVIVVALTTNTLSEEAYAAKSTRDTSGYFSDCDLNAWKLWYCLDNDEYRFSWADTSNGKGVIYRMIDENNNDVPYDFKNIQFIRYKVTGGSSDSPFYESWQGPWFDGTSVSNYKYHYTFCAGDDNYRYGNETYDSTVVGERELRAANNIIARCAIEANGEYIEEGSQCAMLNNIVFNANYRSISYCGHVQDDWEYDDTLTLNVFGLGCYNMTFNGYTSKNVFLSRCYENSMHNEFYGNFLGNNFNGNKISIYFYKNTIGNEFHNNAIEYDFYGNTIGNEFHNNAIGYDFYGNTIGNYFEHNTIGYNFYGNTIGNYFEDNTIGNSFEYNTIGNGFNHSTIRYGFEHNTIGNVFHNNTIGNYFYKNTIGNVFHNNTIGNYFYNNTIGNYFNYNEFTNDYIEGCSFKDNIEYCSISEYTTGNSRKLQNIIVLNGTKGSSTSNRLSLSFLTVGVSYSQICGRNSSGTYTKKNILD